MKPTLVIEERIGEGTANKIPVLRIKIKTIKKKRR